MRHSAVGLNQKGPAFDSLSEEEARNSLDWMMEPVTMPAGTTSRRMTAEASSSGIVSLG